jgi:hypothetical protein
VTALCLQFLIWGGLAALRLAGPVQRALMPLIVFFGGVFLGTFVRGLTTLAGRVHPAALIGAAVGLGTVALRLPTTGSALLQSLVPLLIGALVGFAAAGWWAGYRAENGCR